MTRIRSRLVPVKRGKQRTRPSFSIDFFSNPTVKAARGNSPSVNTRATIATVTDWEGVTREVLSGENRFGGMRRVRNQLNNTENFASANWVVGVSGTGVTATKTPNFGVAPDGTTTACRVVLDKGAGNAAGDFARMEQIVSGVLLSTKSAWIKSNDGVTRVIALGAGGETVTVTSAWQRLASVGSSSNPIELQFLLRGTLGTSNTADLLVWHPQLEEVTGQSNQNPSEYVSVGVLSSPFQGANVDGVQYFATQNGNTVASNVVTEATGALISSAIRGGLLIEPAATDLLTARADARDMTTANWTLGATMTRARTSVGADGVANKATRLTGGAVAATNIITTTITAAASSRTYSVLIKRVTGTGPVRITQDNFATSTDISGLINSSTYTLVQINQSQLNAQLGIKVDTNLDAIDADWNQFSAGDLTGLVNSRIPDTITTRNADVLSYATTGWLNAASGTLYDEWFNPALISPSDVASINDNSTNNVIRIYVDSGGTKTNAQVAVGGVTQSLLNTPVVTTNATAKAVNIYQLNDFAGYVNNSSLGVDAAGAIPTVSQLQIGHIAGASQLGHYVRTIRYYPVRLPNATAQALTV